MPPLPVRSVALALLLGGFVAARPAAAMDPAAVADTLTQAVADVAITYESAGGDSETVTINGVSATFRDDTVATLPTVVISGIAERAEGGFTAARIDFAGGSLADPRGSARWATAYLEDVVVPAAEEAGSRPKIRPFRTMSMAEIAVEAPTLATPVEIATIDFNADEVTDGMPSNVGFRATGVKLPTALVANTIVGVMATMMGYEEFVAEVSVDGVYDTAANTASLNALTVDVPTVGTLGVAAEASGFSIRGITDPNDEISKAARANARLDSVRVRIENAGIVERFLDMQAQMLGGTRDDVRKQIVDGALPFALSFVKNVAFREEFRSAAAAFLEDPRSLTITAEPEEPVPLGQFVRAVARAPATLPDLLATRVEANN